MKKRLGFVFFLIVFLLNNGLSQHTNILIGKNNLPEEPSIAIDPKNPLHIVAGANIDNLYVSTDGGLTWTATVLTSSLYGVWGDPCLVADTSGNFYFLHLSNPPSGTGSWIDRIVCQKINFSNLSWNQGSYTYLSVGKEQDKEWAVVDRNTNTLYVTWTQFDNYGSSNPQDSSVILFAKSTDGGQTFIGVKRLNKIAGDCEDSDNTVEGATPALGPNGEVYVSWVGPAGLIFDRSTDQGQTWLDNDIVVCQVPGGWDFNVPGISRCNGLPITACDISNSPYRGTIYINWSDQRNGTTDTDIWLVKSTDGGNTWSNPIRVNNDPPGKHQFFTWMTIDQTTGYLYFVFYDRRERSNELTDVYMAVSKNGGQSFTNFKISEKPFFPYSSVFFGDYTNIAAHAGIVRPIWTRLNYDSLSVWTAIIDTSKLVAFNTLAEIVEDFENQPNPFNYNTCFSFKLHEKSIVNLSIYDPYGKKVAEILSNTELPAGKYVKHFDAATLNLASGTYYAKLTTREFNKVRKLLILR